MTRLVVLLLFLQAQAALAAPCPDRTSTIPAPQRAAWERQAAPQMNAELQRNAPGAPPLTQVKLVRVFQAGTWLILQVNPQILDEAYLFYPGDPATHPYVTQWSGAAQRDEASEIRAWVVQNAPGIPVSLAACFADLVTSD